METNIETYVEDWEGVKTRYTAWWQADVADRPLLRVTAPRAIPLDTIPPQDLSVAHEEMRWCDSEFLLRRMQWCLRHQYFGGEALPIGQNPISSGHALYYGGAAHFYPYTVTVHPAPVGADGYPVLGQWNDSRWWQLACAQIQRFVQDCEGRYFVMPFWGNNAGDTLAVVRGVEQFYLDLYDNSAWVKSAVKQVSDALISVHETFFEMIAATGMEGTVNHTGTWASGRTLGVDCDVAVNFSREMFQDYIYPPLREFMSHADYNVYHLDGQGQLRHIDLLLATPELHAIQWVPGAGHEEVSQWFPLLQHIQQHGKSIVVACQPGEIASVLKHLSPAGLCICTYAQSEDEARKLVELVGRLT